MAIDEDRTKQRHAGPSLTSLFLTSNLQNKLVSKELKELDSEKKKVYEEKLVADKERFAREMKVWEAEQEAKKAAADSATDSDSSDNDDKAGSDTEDDAKPAATTTKKKKKDPTKPAGKKTAYSYFMSLNTEAFKAKAGPDEQWPETVSS